MSAFPVQCDVERIEHRAKAEPSLPHTLAIYPQQAPGNTGFSALQTATPQASSSHRAQCIVIKLLTKFKFTIAQCEMHAIKNTFRCKSMGLELKLSVRVRAL